MEENDDILQQLIERYKDYTNGTDSGYFDTDELSELLYYYIDQDNKQAVQDILELAKRIHPRSTETLKMQALTLLYTGEVKSALQEIDKLNDNDFEATILRITALLAINKKTEARQIIDPIISNPDTDADMLYDIAKCYIATMSFRQGAQVVKQCLQRFPDNTDLIYLSGQFYDLLDKHKLAEKAFKTIIDKDPFDAAAWFSLAELYTKWGKLPLAIEAIDYTISIEPHDIAALHFKADLLTLAGNTQEAIQVLLDALQEGSDEISVYLAIGRNYMIDAQFTKADEWYAKAENKAPRSKRVMLSQFDLYLAAEDFQQARRIIKKMQQHNMPSPMIYERLGMLDSLEGHFLEALTNYSKALRHDPQNLYLLTKMGLAEWELGNYAATKRYITRALNIDHNFLYGYMVLSAAYFKLGQYRKMLEIVGDPIFLKDPNNVFFFQLCPETKPNFNRILDAIRHKKDIQPLLVYPAPAADNK